MRTRSLVRSNRITLVALLLALVASAVQVTPVYAASISVNSNEDTRFDDGKCTLREAIDAANTNTGSGNLPGECAAGSASGVDTITFVSNSTITLGSQLAVTSSILIQGGLVNTIIQANANPALAQYRVFVVGSIGNLTLENLTVRHGSCNGTCQVLGNNSPNSGAGISNAGVLTVRNSTISDNSAVVGAGIWNGGTLIVENSIFSRNTASNGGGGIWNQGTLTITSSTFLDNAAPNGGGLRTNGGSATITNSTFSGNSVQLNGGGIFNEQSSTMTVKNSTFAGNSALNGGGVYNGAASLTLINTIVANSPNGGNCAGAITNGGGNLDSGATCGWGSAGGSLSDANPKLGSLADNGGPTRTHALSAGSPAIAKGTNCPATDQRGVRRPQGCDMGAFETSSIVVNSDADTVANDGFCTLREAIVAANTNAKSGTMAGECSAGSDTGTDSIRISVNTPITLAGSSLPVITSPIIITGRGPEKTIIQASPSPNVATHGVFRVGGTGALGDLTLNQLTVRHGNCWSPCTGGSYLAVGGGIFNDGFLTILNSNISDNSAGNGGAIFNLRSLTIVNSVLSRNQANSGGAIYTFYSPAPSKIALVTLTNSTLSENSAMQRGGAISTIGWVNVTNSTIAGNSAGEHGGNIAVPAVSGRVALQNTIVANSQSGENCWVQTPLSFPSILDEGGNLSWPDATCPGLNADPMLGPLSNNSGPTQTMALLAGSAAIDAAHDGNCPDTDQRGGARPTGSHCDIGAFEFGAPIVVIPTLGEGPDTTGVFRPINGLLYLKNSNVSGFADIAINYGIPGDYPVVGDWDGDGVATIGVYRSGRFLLRNSNTIGFAEIDFVFGQPGDQPVAGDWDGDGDDTIGVYRPSNGQFLLRNSNSAGPADFNFFLGNVGDVGIAGDWDGDGMDTTGVFRPVNGIIFLKNTNDTGFADIGLNYGIPGDKPVIGDWNDDGVDTIGVYRNGRFLLRNSNDNGFAEIDFDLGNPGDHPIAGNWDGLP